MKALQFIFLLFIAAYSTSSAQDMTNRCGERFVSEKYPTDSFSVKELKYDHGDTEIIFTLLHHNYPLQDDNGYGSFQIWIEQRKNNEVLKSEYWGFEEGENGYQLPATQLLNDYFIVNRSREFTGTFYLISKEGNWHKIPGAEAYWSKDKSRVYTFVPVECGGCDIAKFDPATGQLSKKLWDGHGAAWEEIKDRSGLVNLFENGEWIKWQE